MQTHKYVSVRAVDRTGDLTLGVGSRLFHSYLTISLSPKRYEKRYELRGLSDLWGGFLKGHVKITRQNPIAKPFSTSWNIERHSNPAKRNAEGGSVAVQQRVSRRQVHWQLTARP